MRKTRIVAVACVLLAVAGAMASPTINSAVIHPRIWNDDPNSTFTSTNLYPTTVAMQDVHSGDTGWTNLHTFRLSVDGANDAVFMNNDGFVVAADVKITGTSNVEGGLGVSPWWSPNAADGVFMINTESGEIACFGARLPFFSFTANNGLHYTKGQTVRERISYDPRGLSESDPGAIKYWYTTGGITYSSPWLKFNQGDPNEGVIYGNWGILNGARVGGYFMPKVGGQGDPPRWGAIEFSNFSDLPEPAGLLLVGLAAAFLRRGR